MKIAVIVHVFYPDIWPQLAGCIQNIDDPFDLYITYSDDAIVNLVQHQFPTAVFTKCENRGYDVWPFLQVLNQIELSQYAYIIKLHTKRDVEFPSPLHLNGHLINGSEWRRGLLSFMDTKDHWNATKVTLSKEGVGMVGGTFCIARKYDVDESVEEFCAGIKLAKRIGIRPCHPRYVAGTMFAARAQIFAPLIGKFCDVDFETMVTHCGCQLAHHLERVLGFCACRKGMRLTNCTDTLHQFYVDLDKRRREFFIRSFPSRVIAYIKRKFRCDKRNGSERLMAFLKNDFYAKRKMLVGLHKNGVIVPGPVGAIADVGQYVVDSMSYSVRCPEEFRIVPEESEIIACDEDVLFLGSFESCWGHCITDNLKHLWILQSPEIEKYRSLKWCYTLEVPEKGLPVNFVDLLAALGVTIDRLTLIDRPTRFKKVYMPDPCFYCDASTPEHYRYYTKEFESLIERIIATVDPNRNPNPQRKVYLTRTGWKKGNPDFGEKYVEGAFVHKGFEIVHPEDLSFAETVKLMGECGTLGSTEGSTAHNSIFMQRGTNLVVLRKANYINEYQPPISQMRNLNVTYVDAHRTTLLASNSCPFSGPFFLYCNKALSEYTGLNSHFPLVVWFGYASCCIKMRLLALMKRVVRHLGIKYG